MIYFNFLFVLLACQDNTFSNKQASEYFPNKIGNYWEYSVIDSIGGRPRPSFGNYNVSIRILGLKIMADGRDAYIWQYRNPWGIDTSYVRIENDTVKTFDRYSKTINSLKFPRQIFPIPFDNNQKWSGKLLVIDTYTSTRTSDGYLIDYHYVGPNIEYTDKLYFKSNIGFVRLDKSHYNLGPIDHQIWKLQKYSLK